MKLILEKICIPSNLLTGVLKKSMSFINAIMSNRFRILCIKKRTIGIISFYEIFQIFLVK